MSKLVYFLALAVLLSACSKEPTPPATTPDSPTPPATTPDLTPDLTPDAGKTMGKAALGTSISLDLSKNAGSAAGLSQADVVMAAATFDDKGKITSAYIDTTEIKVEFDKTGKITTSLTNTPKTKKQLGDAYGMKKASSIGKEWWEQIKAFEDYVVGKTIAELQSMPVKERDTAAKHVPDVPELVSSVTISIEEYVSALADAETNSKK